MNVDNLIQEYEYAAEQASSFEAAILVIDNPFA